MPIKAIKHVNKGNIAFQSKANYDQIYSSILKVLGKDAPFAPLTMRGAELLWNPIEKGNYKSLSEAPDEVLVLWDQTQEDLRKRLSAQNLEFVLEVPDSSYIFYKEDVSADDGVLKNRYKLLITGWACKYGMNENNEGDDGLESRMVKAKERHQNVIVKMQNPEKQPLGNADFLYVFENAAARDIKTDAVGCYEQGVCVVGAKLTYTYKLTGQSQSFTVQKNIEVYPLTFASTTTVCIQVIDQHGRPVQSHPVRIEYGEKVFDVNTDGLGKICLPDVLYMDASLQMNVIVDGLGQGVFPVEYPQCHIVMRVNVPEKVQYYLKVVQQNLPVAGHSIRLDGAVKGIYAADGDGLISLGTLQEGDSIEAESTVDKNAGKQCFVITAGQTEYIYLLPEKQAEPEREPYSLKVIRENLPVADHSVKLDGAVNGIYVTDENGLIPLDTLKPGDFLSVVSTVEAEAGVQHFVMTSGQTEYIYRLPEKQSDPVVDDFTGCFVKVVQGAEQKPVPDYSLKFESKTMNGLRLTDENGIVPLENMQEGLEVRVYGERKEPYVFVMNAAQKEYIIQLEEVKAPQFIVCHVKLVSGEKQVPLPDYLLRFESVPMNGTRRTDENGIVPLENMEVGVSMKVHASDLSEPMQFVIVAGKEEYLIQLPEREKEPEEMPCYIKLVRGEKRVPVGNYSLRIESDTMHGNFQTDTYGILPLQHMTLGEEVTCYVKPNTDEKVSFVIEKGKEEYLIQLEEKPVVALGDIMITLLDRDKTTPVTPAMITLTNQAKRKFVQQNDASGNIIVPRDFFVDGQKVRFHAESPKQKIRDCKIRYVQTCDHYFVYLTDPFNWKRLLWLLLLPLLLLLSLIQCERDITVHTVDAKGTNVSNAMVQLKYTEHALYKEKDFFYNRSRQYQGITNSEGYYTFKRVPCSVYSYIFYSFQSALAAGSRNSIVKGETKFAFHWKKDVTVVLEGRKIVQVRSIQTDQPIPQARVDIKCNDLSVVDTTMLTNEEGICALPFSASRSNSELAQMIVTKSGYSGVQLNQVDMNENDSLPFIVYLGKPDPCQDQMADNRRRDQGNMAMKDYDMGVDHGTFQFQYYTDSAPDAISIYDGSSSDLLNGNVPRIFHYEGATNTTTYKHNVEVTFNSRFICVVVSGGTNWGYIVRCPEYV